MTYGGSEPGAAAVQPADDGAGAGAGGLGVLAARPARPRRRCFRSGRSFRRRRGRSTHGARPVTGRTVRATGQTGQQLADVNPRDRRRDRLERPAVLGGRVGLHVEGVEMARPAPEPEHDDGCAGGGVSRAAACTQRQSPKVSPRAPAVPARRNARRVWPWPTRLEVQPVIEHGVDPQNLEVADSSVPGRPTGGRIMSTITKSTPGRRLGEFLIVVQHPIDVARRKPSHSSTCRRPR